MLFAVTGISGGKTKRTVVRIDHRMPTYVFVSYSTYTLIKHDKTYDVQCPAEYTVQLEGSVLWQHFPTAENIDSWGNSISHPQSNNRCSSNGVECAARPQEDAAEHNDPSDCPKQGVQRNVECRVNPCEEAAKRHTAISRKRIAHSCARAN